MTRKKHNYENISALIGDDDYNLWSMVQLTRQLMSSSRDREVSEYGISNIEAIVLFMIQIIRETGRKATPAEISRWLYQRPHSVSELLKRMEKKGLIRKVAEKDRKNWKNVMLTSKGLAVYDQTSGRQTIHNILSCLSDEERRELWSIMGKVRDRAAGEMGVKKVMPWPAPAASFREE